MRQISIINFGPVKTGFRGNGGLMDIAKVTVFIGSQGTGKSSVAKLISTMTWLEKALIRGDFKEKDLTIYNRFRNKHCAYQNIHNYFNDDTEIGYKGEAYEFAYANGKLSIEKKPENGYRMPKIMYIPAERNFVSAVDKPSTLKNLPNTLYTFLDEFENAKQELKENIELPINDLRFSYQKLNNISWIEGKDFRVRLSEASSGFQSFVPLFLVTRYLALSINKEYEPSRQRMSIDEERRLKREIEKILTTPELSNELRKAALEILSSVVKNACFVNIVEEPEQNLYPASQRQILNKLLEYANLNEGNELILTTHSPYIINYLTLAIQGGMLFEKIKACANGQELKDQLDKIVPLRSCIPGKDVLIYELTDSGSIQPLSNYQGIPSDKNFLNQALAEGNQLFDALLEIEELCQ